MNRISVLITLDCPPWREKSEVEQNLIGVEIFFPNGTLMGKIGFAAVPKDRRALAEALLSEEGRNTPH